MDITDVYTATVALYEKTHFYHIKSIGLHYTFHQLTGEQWEELTDAVDTLGEQIIVLEKNLADPISAIE